MSGSRLALLVALCCGLLLRLWRFDAVGFNSDEAVYAGQAAALAGDPVLSEIFPVFRAHPLLFQLALSGLFRFGVDDASARLLAIALGACTIVVTYLAGAALWSRSIGALAAVFVALDPYHVVVSRQALLDGPMTLFTTASLGCLGAYGSTRRPRWLAACAASLGLAVLTKETAAVLLGAAVVFVAIAPEVGITLRSALRSLLCLAVIVAAHPVALTLAGGGGGRTTRSYLVWQLLRRPNHDWVFYLEAALPALGPLLVVAAAAALWRPAEADRWKIKLLSCWIVVPLAFFQLWPVKGFQYLLPIAPAVALLGAAALLGRRPRAAAVLRGGAAAGAPGAADGGGSEEARTRGLGRPDLRGLAAAAVALSLALPAWAKVGEGSGIAAAGPTGGRLLAGAGGVPGGREAGRWVGLNVPEGATLMTIGPSMANILQFYGGRRAYGLSVSSNPLRRNPSYEPIRNPDAALRRGDIQYVVWDRWSASRSEFFSERLRRYVEKYHGRAVHSEGAADDPSIVIYEVRP